MKNIEIAVCYHKENKLFENECLLPIQVGVDCSDVELGLVKDNTGDNISYKNFHYAELTAMYWLWKNSKAKVKGLLHYRRLLDLNMQNINSKKEFYTLNYEDIADTNDFMNSLGLNETNINNLLSNFDIITRTKQDLRTWSNYTVKTHYKAEHTVSHLGFATQVLKKLYPEYVKTWNRLLNQHCSYFTNTIIMKSEDYDNYCEWLFSILFDVEKHINLYSSELAPNTKKARWAGFLAERLTALYIIYQQKVGKKIAEFPAVVLEEQNREWNSVNTYDDKKTDESSDIVIETENNKPIVSVCVAVYNTSKYLKSCLDSIINASLKNIEIICVDDGSTDDSLNILNEYAKNDTRFIVISQNNSGSGTARNKCIQVAQGKYLHFMDSDDFMDRDFLKNMVQNAEKYGSDIVISTHRAVEEDKLTVCYTSSLMHTLTNKDTLNIGNCPDLLLVPCHAWDKLFKKELINDITFPPKGNGEDMGFWYKTIIKAQKVSIHRKCEYNYRINLNSVQTKPKNIMNVFPILDQTYEIFLNDYKEYKPLFDLFVYTLIMHMVGRGRLSLINDSNFRSKFYSEILKIVKKIEITDALEQHLPWYNMKLNDVKVFKRASSFADLEKFFKLDNCNGLLFDIFYTHVKYFVHGPKKRKKYVARIQNKFKYLPDKANIKIGFLKKEFLKKDIKTYSERFITCVK